MVQGGENIIELLESYVVEIEPFSKTITIEKLEDVLEFNRELIATRQVSAFLPVAIATTFYDALMIAEEVKRDNK